MALVSLPLPRLLFSSRPMSIAQKNLIPNLVPMATQSPNSNWRILHMIPLKGVACESGSIDFQYKTKLKFPTQRRCEACCFLGVAVPSIQLPVSAATISGDPVTEASNAVSESVQWLVLMDLDQGTAKLAIAILGPILSAFSFLFIARIVMSWYPKLPVGKFPYIVAYAPTEPVLILTRKVIPPLAGVDVTPVVWFGLISFLNEILVGPQGLLVLLSQQV